MNPAANKLIQKNICNPNNSSYPNFAPSIYNLNVSTSVAGAYTVVHIIGDNFLPPVYGITYVNFGIFTNIPIIFYSTFNISFVVPQDAVATTYPYNVEVVNVYNNNFGSSINYRAVGSNVYSNNVSYTITN